MCHLNFINFQDIHRLMATFQFTITCHQYHEAYIMNVSHHPTIQTTTFAEKTNFYLRVTIIGRRAKIDKYMQQPVYYSL